MVLKDKIILKVLQKKNIPEDISFIILKYYKKMLYMNNDNSQISQSNKIQIFLIFLCIYSLVVILICLVVFSQRYNS